MSESEREQRLLKRITELEQELQERENDLALFRDELVGANRRIEQMIGQLQGELTLASSIQSLLVPTEFPNIPGFEFSTKFIPSGLAGGDYLDIFEHEDKFKFGIILSNASGYSTSALLLSVFLRMSGAMEARRGKDARDMLKSMIDDLKPQLQERDRASLFYGVVNRRQFELDYSAVGHLVALHYSYSESKLTQLSTVPEMLSSRFEAHLNSGSIALNPRDRLVLCSQGVIEAASQDGEKFGIDRLYETVLGGARLSVHELRNEILFRVKTFVEPVGLKRDVSVIVTEVKDRVIKLAKPLSEAGFNSKD